MTMPCEEITVKCQNCGNVFNDFIRGSINLNLDDFDEGYLDRCTYATCPECKHRMKKSVLIVDKEGIFHFDNKNPLTPKEEKLERIPITRKIVKELIDGKTTEQAAKDLLSQSNFTSKEKLLALVNSGYETVLNSEDPFIYYVINTQDEAKREKGKQFMIWGIIALTVMVCVWGLVSVLGNTFGIVNVIPKVNTQ